MKHPMHLRKSWRRESSGRLSIKHARSNGGERSERTSEQDEKGSPDERKGNERLPDTLVFSGHQETFNQRELVCTEGVTGGTLRQKERREKKLLNSNGPSPRDNIHLIDRSYVTMYVV